MSKIGESRTGHEDDEHLVKVRGPGQPPFMFVIWPSVAELNGIHQAGYAIPLGLPSGSGLETVSRPNTHEACVRNKHSSYPRQCIRCRSRRVCRLSVCSVTMRPPQTRLNLPHRSETFPGRLCPNVMSAAPRPERQLSGPPKPDRRLRDRAVCSLLRSANSGCLTSNLITPPV